MGVPDGSVLPAGAVDLVEPQPATDVLLIGPKCSLVVRNDLHAVVQYRLLEAAVEIHSPPSMFRAAGQFPASESIDLPLSPYARDFYKTGSPFFLRHLPFWLAVASRAATSVAYSFACHFISPVPSCTGGL